MATIGHEAPLNDYRYPADLGPIDPLDPQLSIGQAALEPEPVPEELPPGLRLTEKERARVDMLMETQGDDFITAVFHTVSTKRARAILGFLQATHLAAKYKEESMKKRQEGVPTKPSVDELIALLRDTRPSDSDRPIEPVHRAA